MMTAETMMTAIVKKLRLVMLVEVLTLTTAVTTSIIILFTPT